MLNSLYSDLQSRSRAYLEYIVCRALAEEQGGVVDVGHIQLPVRLGRRSRHGQIDNPICNPGYDMISIITTLPFGIFVGWGPRA